MAELPALSISVTEAGQGAYVVALEGELDLSSAPSLQPRLTELRAGSGETVVIDVATLAFVDSTGLNALVAGARAIESRGAYVAVAGASSHLARVFEIVRLAESVPVEPSVEVALTRAHTRAVDPAAEGSG